MLWMPRISAPTTFLSAIPPPPSSSLLLLLQGQGGQGEDGKGHCGQEQVGKGGQGKGRQGQGGQGQGGVSSSISRTFLELRSSSCRSDFKGWKMPFSKGNVHNL